MKKNIQKEQLNSTGDLNQILTRVDNNDPKLKSIDLTGIGLDTEKLIITWYPMSVTQQQSPVRNE